MTLRSQMTQSGESGSIMFAKILRHGTSFIQRASKQSADFERPQIGRRYTSRGLYNNRGGQMKKLFVFIALFAMSSLTFAANDKTDTKNAKLETVTGVVSDAKCGAANHDADCVKKCEEAGEPLVIVNDKDKSVMSVKNPEVLKGHEGIT